MKINADFEQRVVVHSSEAAWIASPMAGVMRKPLDRIGDEIARATSLVRYAPGSSFSAHTHHGGEEFLVLDGTFQDEHGDYPAGSYVRNPIGTRHTPASEEGCVIFVKLWQFSPEDNRQFTTDINRVDLHPGAGGVRAAILHRHAKEIVSLLSLEPGTVHAPDTRGGLELLVLDGEISEGSDRLCRHDWARWPDGRHCRISAGARGALLWLKQGHLCNLDEQVRRLETSGSG